MKDKISQMELAMEALTRQKIRKKKLRPLEGNIKYFQRTNREQLCAYINNSSEDQSDYFQFNIVVITTNNDNNE